MTTPALQTPSIDEYLTTSEWDGYELDEGMPVDVPMSTLSAWVGGAILARLRDAARLTGGFAFPQETALRIWPDRPHHLRKPDAMYFSPGTLPRDNPMANPIQVAPGIAVEVISPNESAARIEVKSREYMQAGIGLLWVVYPDTQSVHILRPGGSAAYLGPNDTLTGEDILPEFSVRVADVFPPAAQD